MALWPSLAFLGQFYYRNRGWRWKQSSYKTFPVHIIQIFGRCLYQPITWTRSSLNHYHKTNFLGWCICIPSTEEIKIIVKFPLATSGLIVKWCHVKTTLHKAPGSVSSFGRPLIPRSCSLHYTLLTSFKRNFTLVPCLASVYLPILCIHACRKVKSVPDMSCRGSQRPARSV